MKSEKNKAFTSNDQVKELTKSFFFPDKGVTIQAKSLKEAIKLLNNNNQ